MNRAAIVLIQLAVVAACVALALHYFDMPRVLAALALAPPWKIAVAVAGECIVAWPLSALRLVSLGAPRLTWLSGFTVLCLGQILNMLLPMKLGEAARMALLARCLDNDLPRATEISFWERFSDLNALFVMLLLSGAALGGAALALPVGALALGMWAAVLALKFWGGPLHQRLARLPWPRLGGYLAGVAGAIRLRLTPGFALGLGLLTAPNWTGQVLVQGFILVEIFQLPLTPLQALAVVAAGIAGQSLPGTPGGIGLYEAAVVGACVALGQPPEQALAAALAMHAINLAPKFIGGTWALSRVGGRAALRFTR